MAKKKKTKRKTSASAKAKTGGRGRSRVATEAEAENKADIEALGTEYKAFHANKKAKSDPVPEAIKQKARKLIGKDVSYTAIANAAGVAIGTVKGWVGANAKPSTGNGSKKAGRPKKTGASEDRWIKIRLNGRELELLESDYLRLYGGEK